MGINVEGINFGKTVNVLHPGNTYNFIVTGRFITDFSGVFFGIHIRSISGVAITGQRYPEEGALFKNAKAGEAFNVRFSFKMDLLPGVYFSGGGIWSSQDPECAHRILDALMFRVIPKKRQHSFGYVDSSAGDPSLEIIK